MVFNYYFRNFFTFSKKSIAGPVTLLFILLGFITLTFTSYYSIQSSVSNFVNLSSNYVVNKLYQADTVKKGDVILKNIDKESDELKKLSSFINSLYLDFASDYSSITNITFFMRDDKLKWSKIKFDSKHILRSSVVVEKDFNIKENSFAMNGFESVVKYVDITNQKDQYKYVLRTTANIKLLNILSVSAFSLSVIAVLILVLSRLFAIRISLYIEKNADLFVDKMKHLSQSNFDEDIEFQSVKEFSELYNSLTGTFESLKKTSEMLHHDVEVADKNQLINKKILSAATYSELLLSIREIIQDEFPVHTIGIAVRTSFDNGFTTYTEVNNRKALLNKNGFYSDDNLNSSTMDKLQDYFEMNNDSESTDILFFVYEIAGDSFGSFINIPLNNKGIYFGSLVISKIDKDGFSEENKTIIEYIARWIGASINKFRVVNEKIEFLTSVIMTFSKIADNRPGALKEHSINIAKISEKIGMKLGFSDPEIIDLMIAALLHDIGKLKNSKDINKHPQLSADIVFEQFPIESIKEGILYHHEMWDGSGYPKGLKADQIPLNAQIISIADFFENAVTVKKWSTKRTLSFMLGKKGISFSPELIDIFIKTKKS